MVTTIGPWKRPAGRQVRLETNIGTRVPLFHVSHTDPRVHQSVLEG